MSSAREDFRPLIYHMASPDLAPQCKNLAYLGWQDGYEPKTISLYVDAIQFLNGLLSDLNQALHFEDYKNLSTNGEWLDFYFSIYHNAKASYEAGFFMSRLIVEYSLRFGKQRCRRKGNY